jgi:hypothetical protein
VGSPYLNQRRRKHALPRENGLCWVKLRIVIHGQSTLFGLKKTEWLELVGSVKDFIIDILVWR